MQRCDRCVLRNRMARIPRTLRVPTPHPERVLRATFQSFHKEPCACATRRDPGTSQRRAFLDASPRIHRRAPPSVAAAHFSTAVVGVSSTLSPVGAPGGTASVVGLTELLAGLSPSEFTERTWIVYCVFGLSCVTRCVVFVLPVATHVVPATRLL